MTITIHAPETLSNADYQASPQISGTGLHTIYSESPAQWRFGEPEPESKALEFGIRSHAMILEPDRFQAAYARDFDASVYEKILTTGADMTGWLKERGVKSSGAKAELIRRIIDTGEEVHIYDIEQQKYRESLPDREFIKPDEFTKLERMRAAIMADDECAKMLEGGSAEYSLIGDNTKVRPDIITAGGGLVNYKTCRTCHPDEFGRNSFNYGYILKAALEWDMFKLAYGEAPAFYCLLAQQKHSPYIFKPWMVPKDIIAIGRIQYTEAFRLYQDCLEKDLWPGFGGSEYLSLPQYITSKFEV